MKLFDLIKYGFTILFIAFNVLTYLLVEDLESQERKCKCIQNKEVTNAYYFLNAVDYVKTFSTISIILMVVNLFLPVIKTFTNIFLVGSILTLLLVILLVLECVSLNIILNEKKVSPDCRECTFTYSLYDTMSDYLLGSTLTIYAIAIGIILIGSRL